MPRLCCQTVQWKGTIFVTSMCNFSVREGQKVWYHQHALNNQTKRSPSGRAGRREEEEEGGSGETRVRIWATRGCQEQREAKNRGWGRGEGGVGDFNELLVLIGCNKLEMIAVFFHSFATLPHK